jgi:integrase
MARKPRLGQFLEWHGETIRVRVTVPPSMRKAIGATALRESLGTSSPREAEALKHAVVGRLKAQIRGEMPRTSEAGNSLTEHALRWRDAIRNDFREGEDRAPYTARDVLIDDVLPRIAETHGRAKAAEVLAVADGRATPLASFVKDMIEFRQYKGRTAEKLRNAVDLLAAWCAKAGVPATIEGIDQKTARRFVQETFVGKVKNSATARDTVAQYGRYWRWCAEDSGHFPQGLTNPFAALATKLFPKSDDKARRKKGWGKQPFTDAEVRTLFGEIADGPFPDFMRIAAFSGMRGTEIARLTVAECEGGSFFVSKGKTVNSIRRVPIHPELAGIVERRTQGKAPTDRLFHDLPGTESETRSPYAALSQRFTRRRRELKIGDSVPDSRQDTKDFHSFRRWFMFKAAEALNAGAKGYSPWTIAAVVGHDEEDGELPLGMTMSRYPGDATEDAKRACVEAVQLPRYTRQ